MRGRLYGTKRYQIPLSVASCARQAYRSGMDVSPPTSAPDGLEATLREHHLAALVLFGSRARGTAHAGSDVDLAALRMDGRRMSHRELADLHTALSTHFDGPVDVVDLATADALIRFEILREGRLVRCLDRDAWVGLTARTLIEHDDVARFVGPCIRGVGRAARRAAV